MINVAKPKFDEPLDRETNPFGSGVGPRWAGSPVQTALGQVIRHIEVRRPVIVVAGKAGTGKTLLMDMIARACSDMGLSARQIDRGDLANTALDARSDVLLVDEADSIPDSAVHRFMSPAGNDAATTSVFLCLPSSVHRFSCPDTDVVELRALSVSDALTYLLERANSIGHPDLFTPDALDLILHRARGSPRLLRSIASLAFFAAAYESETQISVRHIAYALKSQMTSDADEDGISRQGDVSLADSPDQSGTRHSPGREQVYRRILKLISGGHESVEHLLRRLTFGRPVRLTAATIAIAAFLGVAGAGLLEGDNNSSVGSNLSPNVIAPAVSNPVEATVGVVQTLAATPVSPAYQTPPAGDAVEPTTAASAPAAIVSQATSVSSKLNPSPAGRARAAQKRADSPGAAKTARSPVPVKTARSPVPVKAARSPGPTKKAGSPASTTIRRIAAEQAAAKKAADRARNAEEVARQAGEATRQAEEATRQAEEATRQAEEATRQAEEAQRQADDAVRQAEAVARQADWGIRLRLPWQRR